MAKSGWCQAPPRIEPPHEKACKWPLCQCECHKPKEDGRALGKP